MPTYEYECAKCGHRFESFQSIKEAPKKACPLCKGRVRRLIGTGAGLIFKGSGFYITDYRSEGYKSAVKKETATPGSKPAASAESKSKSTTSESKK